MEIINACPGDILVTVNWKKDLWSRIRRWAVGPYSHCYLFLGNVALLTDRRQGRLIRVPMIFESMGRGVVLRSLSEGFGESVVVARLKSYENRKRIPTILVEAIKLASDPQAYYDYKVVVWHIIPRVLFEKLGINLPLKYQRDQKMICSEACAEAFWRAGVEVVPKGIVPLPSSFVESRLLTQVWEGKLSEDAVK